jgi:hypothetical protein
VTKVLNSRILEFLALVLIGLFIRLTKESASVTHKYYTSPSNEFLDFFTSSNIDLYYCNIFRVSLTLLMYNL